VITARDGYKLTIRSIQEGAGKEEYSVEAVEVVAFGETRFFRSLEKPQPFLLPIHSYLVLEVRETRVVLKSVSIEKSIKIGGGRDGAVRNLKEAQVEKEPVSHTASEVAPPLEELSADSRRKDRRRHRRRRTNEERNEMKEWSDQKQQRSSSIAGEAAVSTAEPAATIPQFGAMIPPPTTLIAESFARKTASVEEAPASNQNNHIERAQEGGFSSSPDDRSD
jgi:hypothetical protein